MTRPTKAADEDARKPKRTTRRTPDEVRELLLDSARELFSARGYAGTSTRDIAQQAGVSEALLFRHYGTKAKLFERAILDPINDFVHDYVEEWTVQPATSHTPESVSRAFVEGLYDLLSRHRKLVMALVTAQAYESIDEVIGASPLSRILDELEAVARHEAGLRDYHFDIPVATRVVTGMVMAVTLFDDWLFGPGRRRPSRQRVVDEMVSLMVHGLAHRDEASLPARKRA